MHQLFEQTGQFNFDEAEPILDRLIDNRPSVGIVADPDWVVAVRDIMLLNAAEASLPPFRGAPELVSPHLVDEVATRIAFVATDSGPFVAHNPLVAPGLWDVTLLGSDANKLAWQAQSSSLETVSESFLSIAKRLIGFYRIASESAEVGPIDTVGVVRTKCTLWRAKLGVLLNESEAHAKSDIVELLESGP
jgi:hypothetical protein